MRYLSEAEWQRIETIIDNFDFDKVHIAMVALKWTWAYSSSGIPSLIELKHEARRLLKDVLLSPSSVICCGGFRARKDSDGVLSLAFEIDSFEEYLDEN